MTKRIHFSATPLKTLYSTNTQTSEFGGEVGFKPNGLWYSIDDAWEEWCRQQGFDVDRLSIATEIEVDTSKILIIDTIDKLSMFDNKYGANKYINWESVSYDYHGIEISPYFWKARRDFIWYYTWDVASGCIWNTSAILSIKELVESAMDIAADGD